MEITAYDGRLLGKKALATRESLLDALASLLDEKPYRTILVVQVARKAYVSPGTFYQNFPTLDDALLALAERLVLDASAYFADIPECDPYSRRVTLYKAIAFFLENRTLLSALLMLSLESEVFSTALDRVLDPVVDTLVAASLPDAPRQIHVDAIHSVLWSYLAVSAHARFISDRRALIAIDLAFDGALDTMCDLADL